MSQTLRISIIKSLAVNSAKNETFRKGNFDKAVDEKNIVAAYHETAGDEKYHEAMLERAFYSQVEKLKTWFSDYVTDNGNVAEDPIAATEEEDGIDILLQVSERWNKGFTKTLARLSQKYVEDRMVHLWWSVTDEKKSQFYAQLAIEDLEGIKRCFTKTAPEPPAYQFPTAITLRYPDIPDLGGSYVGIITPDNSDVLEPYQLYGNPFILSKGSESEISYTLKGDNGEKPLDDIIVRCDDACAVAALDNTGHWCVKAVNTGATIVTLFSRHNDKVFAKFALRVV